jgi:FixJ family two-component response regulator
MSKTSLLSQIIEKGMDAIKKPFVEKRVVRAFESAKDSIEEQLMDKEAALNNARESLVSAAKREENLRDYINELIEIRGYINDLKLAQAALAEEKAELL